MKLCKIETLFAEEMLEYYGAVPFSALDCRRPDMIERHSVRVEDIRTVISFLIPYYVKDGAGNVSLYARSRDYHFYAEGLFSRLLPKLESTFGGRFLGYADKSPIQENLAASMAGLGVVGDNFMLINEKYGSFVFMGEILTTVPMEEMGFPSAVGEVRTCPHCGACKKACPMTAGNEECLSAVTQKKGILTEAEETYIQAHGYAWGCDICQLACPLNRAVLEKGTETPISFFHEDRVSALTPEILGGMDEETFARRAFSWRGRAVLERNLAILARQKK